MVKHSFIGILIFITVLVIISSVYCQNSEENALKIGAGYIKNGKYEAGIAEFNKVIKTNPDNSYAYFARGSAHLYNSNLYKALPDFNKAIALNPDYANAYNERGIVYCEKKLFDKAIPDFNKTIELNPHHPYAYNNRGMAYRNKGELDEAIADFNKAIEIDPNYATAYANRAIAYFNKKDYTKSWKDVHKAESLGFKFYPEFLVKMNVASILDRFGIVYDANGLIKFNKKGGVMSILLLLVVIAIVLLIFSIRIIQQYETGVVFQLGRYSRTLNPGLNFIIPIIEYSRVVDMRISTHDIPEQQVITKDNVPVSINGVVYFKVEDAQTAVIKVQNYTYAVSQYAQAALRDVVGGMTLDDLLTERQKIGDKIEESIQKEAKAWGLQVTAIKLQDVNMPEDLKKIMSRQASAEREKRATITKAEGDKMAALNLAEAAKTMAASPGAMQLRTLQTIDGLGPSPSNTVVLAVPIDILEAVRGFVASRIEKKQE